MDFQVAPFTSFNEVTVVPLTLLSSVRCFVCPVKVALVSSRSTETDTEHTKSDRFEIPTNSFPVTFGRYICFVHDAYMWILGSLEVLPDLAMERCMRECLKMFEAFPIWYPHHCVS
jgi:hypothetical protein